MINLNTSGLLLPTKGGPWANYQRGKAAPLARRFFFISLGISLRLGFYVVQNTLISLEALNFFFFPHYFFVGFLGAPFTTLHLTKTFERVQLTPLESLLALSPGRRRWVEPFKG